MAWGGTGPGRGHRHCFDLRCDRRFDGGVCVMTRGGGAETPPISRRTLLALFENVEEVVVGLSNDGTITFASPAVRQLLGWDPIDALGRNVIEFVDPVDVEWIVTGLTGWSGRNGRIDGEPTKVRRSDGEWVEVTFVAASGASVDEFADFVVTLRPVGQNDRERALYLSGLSTEERMIRLASTFLGVGADVFDEGLSSAVQEIAGLRWVARASIWHRNGDTVRRRAVWESPDEAPAVRLPPRIHLDSLPRLVQVEEVHFGSAEEILSCWTTEGARALVRAGVVGILAVPCILAGEFTGFVMIERLSGDGTFDTTHFSTLRSAAALLAEAFARNEAELELARRAGTDQLTGLDNRWTFQLALDAAIAAAAAGSSPGVALALVDLDRFKVVNDSFGHDAGDRLLLEVADRFSSVTRAGPTRPAVVARFGGDEFLFLLDRVEDGDDARRRLHRLIRALDPPFHVEGQPVSLTASVGLVTVDGPGADAGEALRRADLAMYEAKRRGGNRVCTDDPAAASTIREQVREEAALRRAIQDGTLTNYVQGEWDLLSGELVGAEVLVRWAHPERGLLTAAEFIPTAEESDLVVALGEHVIQRSCLDMAQWGQLGLPKGFVLRVNLSARQLRHPGLVDQVASALHRARLDPAALCLELTESSLLMDPEAAARILEGIRELGCGLTVDDFGTGYSSLLYLRKLPLTGLKIDRVFVDPLPHEAADRAIVASVVQLAESLGVSLTAEGVETSEQRAVLVDLGCRLAQGYLLSKPEPVSDFVKRLGQSVPRVET